VLITSVVHPSITRISRDEWNGFFGGEAEGYDYYLTLENTGLKGFEFAYACIFVDQQLRLIAPLFRADLDLAIGVEGALAKALAAWRRLHRRSLVLRTLFVGSPFGEHTTIGVDGGQAERQALLHEMAAVARRHCREHRLSFIVFKDLRKPDADALQALAGLGFTRGESFPNIVLPLPYARIEDYLASLSHATRKDLRRKIRRAEAAGITVQEVDNVEDRLAEIYQLYLNTYYAGTVRFEKLTPQYFVEAGRRQRGQVRFFLFFLGGRLVCFNLCFLHAGTLIDKFIGLDYSVARSCNLYFYTWYHNVAWCIRSGVRAYQVGQTDYEDKLRLGGQRVPLFFFARHENRVVNALLRAAAPLLAPGGATGPTAEPVTIADGRPLSP
jgi:hypothetical protein